MVKLHEYARRRNFDHTPEPSPKEVQETPGALRYVVQAHAARSMHYDFRLQIDGVLVSWAVPKGPSMNPRHRRLALLTEDHPLEYAEFEGIIPKGEYGGGSVIVWDEGTWQPEGNPREGLERGKLRFTLHGRKLRGRFHLTRTRSQKSKSKSGDDGSSWLLIKGRDAMACDDEESIVAQAPESVLSGRTLEEVAETPSAIWHSQQKPQQDALPSSSRKTSGLRKMNALPGAKRARFPSEHAPQLATLVSEPPSGGDYLHEAKFDGYRLLAEVRSCAPKSATQRTRVKLWTRSHQDWSQRLPSLVAYLSVLPLGDVLLDGELVALDDRGLSNFQKLQNALGAKRSSRVRPPEQEEKLVYIVFDLIHQDGYDLSQVGQQERKAALDSLLVASRADPNRLRISQHVVGRGADFFSQACSLGMEGIVSKRMDAPYRGQRTQAWLKCKCLKRQEFVIGGYTEPSGSRSRLGAILVGLHDEQGALKYAGKVGTGFSEQSLTQLFDRLSKLTRKTAPFVDPPRDAHARGVHWVSPQLLAEVAFSEMTTGGKLRHASFQGLREDRKARHVGLEQPIKSASVLSASPNTPVGSGKGRSQISVSLPIKLTHPERVLYPEQELSKRDLAEYYVRVSEWMLPHVGDRFLTLVRCPSGQDKPCFYQKHAKEGLPESILSRAHDQAGEEQFVYVHDTAGLVGLVQVGVLEVHTWGSRIDNLDYPDQLVFDLDPDPDLDWVRLVEAALDVKDELQSVGLTSFVKTTGGKGLHVTVPLAPTLRWPEAKAFCKAVAEKLAQAQPSRYVATMTKQKRQGKVFIDYLRNTRGATAVAPYSTRAQPGAPVSTPVAWEELAQDLRGKFHLCDLPSRLEGLSADPWEGFFELGQSLTKQTRQALRLE